MAPIVKDSDTAVAPPTPVSQNASGSKPVADAAARPQPVALEVPVTINGARTIEGSDKREPFAESTQTVLVFPQGAVIRLASPLAPGQLVFLTNEKTKKEVVCQVVKAKNYRTVTGYVELEFTEPAAGFWGMRFPTAVAPTPSAGAPVAPRPVVAPPVAAPKIAAPAVPSTLKPVVPPTQNLAPAKAVVPPVPATKPEAQITPAAPPKPPASPVAKVQAPALPPVGPPQAAIPSTAAPSIPDLAEFLASTAVSPAPTKTETPGPASSPSTEELKLQAAKLQEQLSSMLFSETSKAQKSTPAARLEEKPAPTQTVKKVLELADLAPKPAPISAPPAASKITPITQKPVTSSFDAEEVQIPAWLAPLANNSETKSSASTTAQEAPVHAEPVAFETHREETSASHASASASHSIQSEMFGGQLLDDSSESTKSQGASNSKKGLLIGVAAGLLIAGGAFWYSKQPGNILTGTAAVAPVSTPAVANTTPFANDPAAKPQSSTSANVVSNSPASSSPSLSPAKQPALSESNTSVSANTLTPAVSKQPSERTRNLTAEPPPAPEPKKSVVGNVQLAKPVVNGGAVAGKDTGEATPSIDVNQPANGEGLSGLSAGHAKGPDAPLPIGGDVKQAQLLKSVPPIYPTMAKSQHISGNVKIDALIDASGNVSAMSVLSGPTMLHQAALTAVKQWHYQPAELDGKPTSMHLTVTVQFRLQ
jgi:TonB family protein